MKLLPKGSRVWLYVPDDRHGHVLVTEKDFYYTKIYSRTDYPAEMIRNSLSGDTEYYCVVFDRNLEVIDMEKNIDHFHFYFMWVPRQSFLDI